MQYGELRTNRGSWFINEFFLKLALFNIHDTFNAGNWSFQIFIKLAYLNTHDIFNGDWSFRSPSRNHVKRKCGKASMVRPVFFWNIRRVVVLNQPKSQNQNKDDNREQVRGDRIIPTYRLQEVRENLWMTEFLNAETHTPVLLMNHL